MNFLNYYFTHTTDRGINQIIDNLSSLNIEIASFQYSFQKMTEISFVAEPQKCVSLYYNSFMPKIILRILEVGEKTVLKIEFQPTKLLKGMFILFNGFIAFFEIMMLLVMLQHGKVELYPFFIPFVISIFSVLLPISALRIISLFLKKKLLIFLNKTGDG